MAMAKLSSKRVRIGNVEETSRHVHVSSESDRGLRTLLPCYRQRLALNI